MFEIGRELKRFFQPATQREELATADASVLELLDLDLLTCEAKSADHSAGRAGVQEKPGRLIQSALIWRELARRTGDAAALRRSAACAEEAGRLARAAGRAALEAQAICEQARTGLVGAELFAEDGLNEAASQLLNEALESSDANALHALVRARLALASADPLALHAALEAVGAALASGAEGGEGVRRLRLDRAELLTLAGARLGDAALIGEALAAISETISNLDPGCNPVLLARAYELRGLALLRLAEMRGDAAAALGGLEALDAALDLIAPDHSPLDWARLQHGRGLLLSALAQTGGDERAFLRALLAFGQTLGVVGRQQHLALRAMTVQDRVACMVRRAEARGDVYALDEAEAALRGELAALGAPPEPVAWAVLQLNLAHIYLAQLDARGRDEGERARAGEALLAALEVFGDQGLRTLASLAADGLERLRS